MPFNVSINTLFNYYNTLNAKLQNGCNLELEIRAPVILEHEKNNMLTIGTITTPILSSSSYTLYYFSSPLSPSETYRSQSKTPIAYEKKSTIATALIPYKHSKNNYNNNHSKINSIKLSNNKNKSLYKSKIVLSTESLYTGRDLLYPLSLTASTQIKRLLINNTPKVEIIIRNNKNASIEIEFDPNSYDAALNEYYKYTSVPLWPQPQSAKPMQVSITTLARKLSSGFFYASAKADGIHVLIYMSVLPSISSPKYTAISDNGLIISSTQPIHCIPQLLSQNELVVLEGEYINQNKIYVYDVLMGNNAIYTTSKVLTYSERHAFAKQIISPPLIIKPIMQINTLEALASIRSLASTVPENDGFIITNNLTYSEKFKLKNTSTADLEYIGNSIFVAQNGTSLTLPLNNSLNNSLNVITLQKNEIYEINLETMSVMRNRPDKSIPNAVIPTYCPPDPLSILQSSMTLPYSRMLHNRIKNYLLSDLRYNSNISNPSLIDIGSAKLGDLSKWLHLNFNAIYAIDPSLDLSRLTNSILKSLNESNLESNLPKNQSKTKNKHNIYPYMCTASQFISIIDPKKIKNTYALSIFYVPWSNEFLYFIAYSKRTAIILMDRAHNYSTNSFSVKISNYTISLQLYGSITAESITEPIISINYIISSINQNFGILKSYTRIPIKFPNLFPINDKIFSSMYSAYIIF
jgi:hypothetical protein